jgi:hypothetical protein
MGLVKSVLGSGDGKSPETAFVVIAIEEEYSVLATFSLTLVSQALVNLGASAFDRMEVKKRDSDQTVTLYFNVDRLLQSKSPQKKP